MYNTEFTSARKFLDDADKEGDSALCVKAAAAFGRGLHSRQDPESHHLMIPYGELS